MNTNTNSTAGTVNQRKPSVLSCLYGRLAPSVVKTTSRSVSLPVSMKRAKEVMGESVVLPEELEKVGVHYSPQDVRLLAEKLPSEETFLELKTRGFVMVPVPPQALTFKKVINGRRDNTLSSRIFFHGSWLMYLPEVIGIQSPNRELWIALSPSNVQESYNKSFREQVDLVYQRGKRGKYETSIPLAIEALWFSFIYEIICGKALWEHHMTRTLSSRWEGYHACVCCSDKNVYFYHREDTPNPQIGVTMKYNLYNR